MKNYRRTFIKDKFEVDRALFHLYESLEDLTRYSYPDSISNRLNNFIKDLSFLIFPKCPNGFDIESDKLFLVIDYEKFISKNEKENF